MARVLDISNRIKRSEDYWQNATPETAETLGEAADAHHQNMPSRAQDRAKEFATTLIGQKPNQARASLRGVLQEAGLLLHLQDINHTVRYAERGDVPVEILVTPQWYVNILDHKQELLEQGRKIQWHPAYMQKRYEQWVEGLNTDWCISRQRYNGVPFPVWHAHGVSPIVATPDQLPINPIAQMPSDSVLQKANEQFAKRMQGAALEVFLEKGLYPITETNIRPDTDVMDTWATSSVTMLLNTHFRFDASTPEAMERHGQLFPYDMRPQAHDIIRTWAFYTIAKAYFHFGEIPWQDIVISGHAQDASRAKMSKSKGNTVTPAQMVEKYSADGLRYWSGSVKLGADTIYDETKLGEGRKLINKLFNATKFALRHLLDYTPGGAAIPGRDQEAGKNARPTEESITYPTDLWLISRLNACIEKATAAHEAFEFGDAKQAIEDFFWADLCDNYLEFSKGRLYGEPLAVDAHGSARVTAGELAATEGHPPFYSPDSLRNSAQATLYIAFSSVLRMLAPALPHITEECWSWYFAQWNDKGSIHLEEWPKAVASHQSPVVSADLLIHTVSAVRKWKSERGVSIKTPLSSVLIRHTGDKAFGDEDLSAILGDLLSTCNAQRAELIEGAAPAEAVTTERNPVAVVCEIAEQPA